MCGFLGALFFTHWDPFLSLMVVVNVPWVPKKIDKLRGTTPGGPQGFDGFYGGEGPIF